MKTVGAGADPVYLESTLPGARVVMSTRRGGVSEGPYRSLNLSATVGDDPAHVARNRRLFFDAARLAPPARMRQVHGSVVLAALAPGEAGTGDALVTEAAGLPLACLVADCAPVVVADAASGLVGIAHAGWRGAAAGVVAAMIAALGERGARTRTMHAAVLPSIGPCCFEVGSEVAVHFSEADLRRIPDEKPRLDLHGAIRAQLARAGIAGDRIEVWDLCTRCRDDLFYSYRRDGPASGRMLAAVVREP